MKKLRNLIAVMAMMSMAAVLTGCGDDDDDDDDDGGPQGPVIVAPADEAALTAQNLIYNATVAGQNDPIVLTFPSAGNYQLVQAGVKEQGTITGAARTDNTWTFNVIPNAGQDGAQEGVLRLDFSAANAGTWTFTPTGGQAESGTFTVTTSGGGDPGGDGGDNGGNGGGGFPTTNDLTGRTLQFSYTGGGGDRFDFTSDSGFTWEPAGAALPGTYVFDATTGNIQLTIPGRGETFTVSLTPGQTQNVPVTINIAGGENPGSLEGTYSLSNP